ncbi:MAG: DUF1801 domain-containing protein [Chitinophagaceae bacterium]|nr:MAG: DUF1801 domain-containing protein [Chitinophagaceae bacterium]
MKSADLFYSNLTEPNAGCLTALRNIILKHDHNITESIKYGMPFFSYQKKMLCYFWRDKKSGLPYIGFMEGRNLRFDWLEAGDRARIRIMYIDPYEDIPVKKLKQTLSASIDLLTGRSGKNSSAVMV